MKKTPLETRLSLLAVLFLATVLALWGGCGTQVGFDSEDDGGVGPGPSDGGGGQNGTDGGNGGRNGTDGGGGGPGSDGGTDPSCKEVTLNFDKPLPPNMMLVLDSSTSMGDCIDDSLFFCTKKMDDLKGAVNTLLDQGNGTIRFGLLPFSTGKQRCSFQGNRVDVGDDTVSTIRSVVNNLTSDGNTPTGEALKRTLDYYQGAPDPTRRNFVVLVTDGVPTCPSGKLQDDADFALREVKALHSASVDTFVIGLGAVSNSNPDLLNSMAVAGGRARNGDPKFYEASKKDDLKQILTDIRGMVIECSRVLKDNEVPPVPSKMWVSFDGVSISRDANHQNGWDYAAAQKTINFYGESCTDLKGGTVKKVDIKMGCSDVN